ncbi:MAG: molybdate ABC transporter substrate-binding protein [Actinomycetes bacterium]
MTRRRPAALAVLAVVLLLGACGRTDPSPAASPSHPDGERVTGRVVVLAAASLTETFTEIADRFEREHPGTDVVLSFGGSSSLAQQVVAGAPADVFAAASPATMSTVVQAGDATDPVVFARNRLEIAVPPGNPGKVTGLADFADSARTIALCAPQVPCGAAATQLFAAAGVQSAPDTLEQDVKAVLTKVELGEVDAGLVYRTDVNAAGDAVQGIPVPEATRVVNDYPVAVLQDAPNPQAARAFVELVRSTEGRAVLSKAGFDVP